VGGLGDHDAAQADVGAQPGGGIDGGGGLDPDRLGEEDGAELAGADELAQRRDRVAVDAVVHRQEPTTGGGSGLEHAIALLHGSTERLLAHHVPAGGERRSAAAGADRRYAQRLHRAARTISRGPAGR
jgi:hypothetical protein